MKLQLKVTEAINKLDKSEAIEVLSKDKIIVALGEVVGIVQTSTRGARGVWGGRGARGRHVHELAVENISLTCRR